MSTGHSSKYRGSELSGCVMPLDPVPMDRVYNPSAYPVDSTRARVSGTWRGTSRQGPLLLGTCGAKRISRTTLLRWRMGRIERNTRVRSAPPGELNGIAVEPDH